MRTYRHCKTNCLINQKGQSLVELASFGAILLFCVGMLIQYGMSANYEQNLQMQAFRKAMQAAYERSGPSATVSLSMTKDKSIPNPQDPWGFAEFRPVSASSSATWNNSGHAVYINDYADEEDPNDLPQSRIEINGTSDTFKTAAYGKVTVNTSSSITMVLENTPEQRAVSHEEYREVHINCSDIKVKKPAPGGEKSAYVKIDGLQHTVNSADVDNDNEMETIIAVKGKGTVTQQCTTDESAPCVDVIVECDASGYCGELSAFKYVDAQEGEINTEYTTIYPWETNKKGADINAQQGLLGNYKVVKTYNNSLVKNESPINLSTTTSVDAKQQITHTIRLNDGSTKDYTTTFTPVALSSYEMGVNK